MGKLIKCLILLSLIFVSMGQQLSSKSKKPNGNNCQFRDGRDGLPGRDGRDGKNGLDGKNGQNGFNGKNGLDGLDGKDGLHGKNGTDGLDGQNGKDGLDGKSTTRNWKECAWDKINYGVKSGLIKTCRFNKTSASSYLKVTFASNLRLASCTNCCARWFVTFDGKECSPIPIDVVIYISSNKVTYRPHVITGHCKKDSNGFVNVGINVGACQGLAAYTGDAETGWKSSTRILVEEVDAPQN